MKIILECSNRYTNVIKRKLNLHFDDITYLEKADCNDSSLLIKEISTQTDVEDIQTKTNTNLVCLIDSGEYMFELLEFKPLAFIRSAKIADDLEELITKIQYLSSGLDMMMEFQCGYQTVRLNVKNITHVESYAHYLLIHTANSTIKVREKISVALKKLEPFDFIQVHRSYLINNAWIKKLDSDDITLIDDTIVPIGKKYKKELKKLLQIKTMS